VISNLAQLQERAQMSGDRPALFAAGRMIDYRELASRANETERGLVTLGVGSGDVVAVLLANGLAFAEILHERGDIHFRHWHLPWESHTDASQYVKPHGIRYIPARQRFRPSARPLPAALKIV